MAAMPLAFNVHGHGMQAPGWPDVYFVLGYGCHGWLELKVGKNKPTALQTKIIERLRRLGVYAGVLTYRDKYILDDGLEWHFNTLDEVIEHLRTEYGL